MVFIIKLELLLRCQNFSFTKFFYFFDNFKHFWVVLNGTQSRQVEYLLFAPSNSAYNRNDLNIDQIRSATWFTVLVRDVATSNWQTYYIGHSSTLTLSHPLSRALTFYIGQSSTLTLTHPLLRALCSLQGLCAPCTALILDDLSPPALPKKVAFSIGRKFFLQVSFGRLTFCCKFGPVFPAQFLTCRKIFVNSSND